MDEFPKQIEVIFFSICFTEESIIHLIFFFYVINAFFCDHFGFF